MRLKASVFDRRQFLRWLSGFGVTGVAATVFTPVARFLSPGGGRPPEQVVLEELPALAPGQGVYFRYGQWTSLLIRGRDGRLRAFNARCTHADCTVSWNAGTGQFHCACHDGVYDADGTNIAGPPPAPLAEYFVTEADGKVTIRLEKPADEPPQT